MTDQRVAFICDRKKCKNCNHDCLHTTDINHAANFERTLAPDTWFESKPTVDAVPVRHGKWTRENNYGIWKCSVCGCKVKRANPLKGNIWNYYYCPNCGARMDAERKEE